MKRGTASCIPHVTLRRDRRFECRIFPAPPDLYSASPPIRDPESLISSLEFWVRIRDSKLANLEIPYFGRPKSQERPDDVIIFRVC